MWNWLASRPQPRRNYVVLNPDGDVVGYGSVLLHGELIGEWSGQWIIAPPIGSPQWVEGRLAYGGQPPAELAGYLEPAPLEERLEVVGTLLECYDNSDQQIGKLKEFTWCNYCGNLLQKDVWYEGDVSIFNPLAVYVDLAAGSALCSFLRPGGGLCMGGHP